jgi:hypothetical protein
MSGVRFGQRSGRLQWWVAGAFLLTTAWTVRPLPAQTPLPSSIAVEPGTSPPPASAPDSGIVQTSCPGCATTADLPPMSAGDTRGGCGCGCGPCKGCGCIPGQPKCYCECCCDPQTPWGRFLAGVYNCICCPDPCYEPRWNALADNAFFQEAARPVTQMKLKWDSGFNFKDPDRAEFFWARERTNPNQLQPANCPRFGIGKGPTGIARSLDYEELTLYTEAAQGGFGLFFEVPYVHIDPETGAANAGLMPPTANKFQAGLPLPGVAGMANANLCPQSGFSDMVIGTKSMILDCDCIQITFQFKTWIPVGDFTKGLGTGHVSLEPSLIFGIPIDRDWYLQMQLAYWIPIGGDQQYESDVFHFHLALNRTLWCPCPGLKLIGTIEGNEWSVCYGSYTDPENLIIDPNAMVNGAANPNAGRPAPFAHTGAATIFSIGPGVRFVICDKIDFGVGTAFAVTGQHWAEELIRAEFRWRF